MIPCGESDMEISVVLWRDIGKPHFIIREAQIYVAIIISLYFKLNVSKEKL